MSIYAVICAAGAGSRMGQNKAICRLSEDDTFLTSIVRTLRLCHVDDIVVVSGAESQKVQHLHASLHVQWAYNADWRTTFMLESLACGIHLTPPGSVIIHWPVDCIFIAPEDLTALIDAPASPLAVLSWNGVSGHPMRLSPNAADDLRAHYADFGSLRDFVAQHACVQVEAKNNALLNCNDPDTLARFLMDRNSSQIR